VGPVFLRVLNPALTKPRNTSFGTRMRSASVFIIGMVPHAFAGLLPLDSCESDGFDPARTVFVLVQHL